MFRAYILQNPAGKFYIGQTDDLEAAQAQSLERDLARDSNPG